ncbi:M48 family metallopeptidase [Clostridium faecium]|uniref:M48 family metallopeptidase n=1 Tax=Clostridium faecium TaxID=2762223 RepID=A0ABR8YUJ7_9CLOT|nr:SprT family zinc-dependent metalloprotease [Clostridium faecium]MBD8047958.1 M48 family metallopeptidase [Clostridium faecium]
MRLAFAYGTKTIAFEVEFRHRKTLEISIEPPDIIKVVAPIGTSEDDIIKKVRSKANWIVQKLFEYKNMKYIKIHKELVNGESFMYLGRNYSLQIIIDQSKAKPEVKLHQGKFYITTNTSNETILRMALQEWYREKALEKIKKRIIYFQPYFKMEPSDIVVKEQQKRWGSCTSNNKLLFNWRCVMAPAPVLDYIVVHEMCHMVHMNHSKEYWNLVESIIPDYKERKEWLRNNGVRMDL